MGTARVRIRLSGSSGVSPGARVMTTWSGLPGDRSDRGEMEREAGATYCQITHWSMEHGAYCHAEIGNVFWLIPSLPIALSLNLEVVLYVQVYGCCKGVLRWEILCLRCVTSLQIFICSHKGVKEMKTETLLAWGFLKHIGNTTCCPSYLKPISKYCR